MNKLRYLFLSAFACLFWGGCSGSAVGVSRFAADSLLREGDVLFRRGEGLVSRAVLFKDPEGVYSHTGIVVRGEQGWEVVHAVPGEPDFEGDTDRVKRDPLDVFFSAQRALRGAVMRYDDPQAARRAAQRAIEVAGRKVLFDHDYDLADTTRLYCTELILHVFAPEGVDLSAGRRTPIDLPGFGGDYVLPGDLRQSPHLESIHDF